MSDGFWVLAYVLAGIIVVIVTVKAAVWAVSTDESSGERWQMELLVTSLHAHPGLKAFLALAGWAVWPLLLLCLLGAAAYAGALVVCWQAQDAWDWLVMKLGRRAR